MNDVISLKEGERLDDLQLGGLKIIQKIGGYGFTSDSVLLANFVKTKHTDVCLEVGTGSGIISILVNYKEKPSKIFAFELQKEQSDLAKRNVELCKMNNQIEIYNERIQNWNKYIDFGQIDVIFANPPYFKYDKNVCGQITEKMLSRTDKELCLKDFFDVCSKMLKFGGKLFFVYDSQRIEECFNIMKQNNLTPKRMYFVHPNENKNSTVFLCEAIVGGKSGLTIMPPLFTNNLDGDYVQTIQKLYKN